MFLIGETSFVQSLRHYSVIIFNFSDIKHSNQNLRIISQVLSKNLRNERNLGYQKNSLQLL